MAPLVSCGRVWSDAVGFVLAHSAGSVAVQMFPHLIDINLINVLPMPLEKIMLQ